MSIIKHEKATYKNNLHKWHCLHDDDRYTLHHEYLKSTTEGHKKYTFDTSDTNRVTNMVTRSQVDIESSVVLLLCKLCKTREL